MHVRHIKGGLGGSFFLGDPGRYVQIVSGYGHLSPGNLRLGGDSYTGDFERWMKEGSFTGELVKQGLEMGVHLHMDPTSGEHGWALLYWGLL